MIRYVIIALLASVAIARGQNYLTTDDPTDRLTADGVTMPAGGQVHSVMQLSTWGGSGGTFISLYADVQEDLTAIKLIANVSEGNKPIKFVWLYLNNQVVATCDGSMCNYLMPVDKMHTGVNEILTAYQPEVGAARGTSFKISKPETAQ